MSYQAKLKDPRWQRKRLEILQRDNWSCINCGDTTRTLHVHHIEYQAGADPWEYANTELVTLCEECHKVAHNPKKDDPPYFVPPMLGEWSARSATLYCPRCKERGATWLHHIRVDVFDRNHEDGDVVWHRVAHGEVERCPDDAREKSPSPRRDGLAIDFWCEGCGDGLRLGIAQHKGQTLLSWMVKPSSPEEATKP